MISLYEKITLRYINYCICVTRFSMIKLSATFILIHGENRSLPVSENYLLTELASTTAVVSSRHLQPVK